MIENSGHLISNDTLIDAVWGGRAVTDGAVGKCIEELRAVFGEEGRQYLRNVRGRGYIFDRDPTERIREVESEEIEIRQVFLEEVNGESDLAAQHIEVQPAGATRFRGRSTTILVIAGILAAAAIVVTYWRFFRQPTAANITSIAVLPLKNESGNSELDYVSDGMTESLINNLSRLPGLSVKARSSVFQYKGKDVDARKVASDLAVQAILSGRFIQHGDDVTLYVSLVEGQTGNQIWGEQFERKLSQLASLEGQTTTDIAQQLNSKLYAADRARLSRGSTENSEAYLAYLKGRYYWNSRSDDYYKSREFFQRAIDIDPTYALGYAGLAHYYGFAAATGMLPPDENWQRSEAAVKKALELDDTRAESYNAIAGVQLYYYRNWTAAEESFKRALQLNPASAEVRNHYARCLMLFGRNEEALAQMQSTLALEPLSVSYSLNAGRLFLFLGQYPSALEQLNNTLELNPKSLAAHDTMGFVYEKMGNEKAAVAEWMKVLSLTNNQELATRLQDTYDRSGFAAVVRMRAEQQLKQLDESVKRGEYAAAAEYAAAYTRMGDKEKALVWLEKAIQEHNRFALEFKINPLYDSLRSDRRFQQLADRVKVS
jgi:TolB-like protein/lipopolysaccharide biosynthesis regulator YciM